MIDPVQYAREFIRREFASRVRDPDPAFWSGVECLLKLTASAPEEIIREAPKDPIAWQYAQEKARECLAAGRLPSPELLDLALRHLAGEVAPPAMSRGRKGAGNWYRALLLRRLADDLESLTFFHPEKGLYKLKRYRNESKGPDPNLYVYDAISKAWEEEFGEYRSPESIRFEIERTPLLSPLRKPA